MISSWRFLLMMYGIISFLEVWLTSGKVSSDPIKPSSIYVTSTQYNLGAQPHVFETYWLNSNICVAHFPFLTILRTRIADFTAA